MRTDVFLWLYIGFILTLGICAAGAWYAKWPDWGAYLLIFGVYSIYMMAYFLATREE